MKKISLVILVSLFVLSCGDKKEKETSSQENATVEVESVELIKEIDSLETITQEIKTTEEDIETSIEKIDKLLNEIEE